MIKHYLIGFILIVFLSNCEDKEKSRMRAQLDSLRTELQVSNQTAAQLEEVGSLIDSIDASRQLLRADVVEGTSYKDYKNRLLDINSYIRDTQTKLSELEQNTKQNTVLQTSIKRLKAELALSQKQITALQEEIEKMQSENLALNQRVTQRDSVITVSSETIKMREQDITALESRVKEINAKAQEDQATMYFNQAKALETAASRTKFAPRKKKDTQREALELYKLSLSLGKEEAQARIEELEKDLS